MLPEGTVLGRLKIEEVFVEYDGPQLFLCSDHRARPRHLLAVHAPRTEAGDNWLYVYIGLRRLKKVVQGKIDLHEAFSQPEYGKIQAVCFTPNGETFVRPVNVVQVLDDWLPMRGERLGNQQDEELLFEQAVEVFDPDELPTQLREPVPMWEFDPAVIDFLRGKRTPVAEASRRTGRVVFDVIFKPRDNRNEMPAGVFGSFLISAQNAVEALAPPLPPGAKGASASELSRLDALPAFPGSFGVRLDAHEASLFPNPRLIQSLQRMAELLSASQNRDAMRGLLKEVGHRAASRFRLFVQALERSDSDVAVEIGIPNHPEFSGASLTRKEVYDLAEFLKAEASSTEETFTFRGQLVGVTLPNKFFALEDDDRIVSGRISDAALAAMFGTVIGNRYDANITAITDINEATGIERTKHILNSLVPVVDS